MNPITVPSISYFTMAPMLVLFVGSVLLMAAASLLPHRLPEVVSTATSVLLGLGALVVSILQWDHLIRHGSSSTVAGALVLDGFSVFVNITVSCAVILTALVAHDYLARLKFDSAEFHILALLSASGALIMGAANDLVVVFLGLEILSIALYVLVALNRKNEKSAEGALKYFVLGGFSSAVFVYGIALTYGATGSTNLAKMGTYLSANVVHRPGLLLAGIGLLAVGFCFKIAAVPFHMWTPDVYEGAPTPVTGFMAAVAKVGGFVAFLRVFETAFSTQQSTWAPLLYTVALLTTFIGATSAIAQHNVKRMLAYSSINHAGFILLGVVVLTKAGFAGSLYYLFTYSVMAIGTFALLGVLGGARDEDHDLTSYRGLAKRRPGVALSLALLLLAQAGMPFTTGFLAKFGVIEATVAHGEIPLALLAMVSATISAVAYLRVGIVMYATHDVPTPVSDGSSFKDRAEGSLLLEVEPVATTHEVPVAPTTGLAIGICLAVTFYFGIAPGALLDFARQAAQLLR